jgi:2-hydroxy-3-oxopropionate reductase
MAAHLLRAGHSLVVLDRPSSGVRALVELGAQTAPTPAAVARRTEAMFTMLPDTDTVENIVFGPDGVGAGIRPGALFIDMSSIAPAAARRIARRLATLAVDALDAPVSGGDRGAIDATLSIMVGGTPAAYSRALPLFELLGSSVVLVGDAGSGQVAKACNQLAVAVTIEATAEALALAEACGADVAKVREALGAGLAASRVLERYGPRMIEGRYEPGARARLHRKDLVIAAELAGDAGIELPALTLLLDRFTELVKRGADLDHSALRTLITTNATQRNES